MSEANPDRFIHLRAHSAYSLAEGAMSIGDIVKMCQARAMPAVAVTDTMNLFGALDLAYSATAAGVQPIHGCEVRLAASASEKRPGAMAEAPHYDTLVLLAQNQTGYQSLLKLVSAAFIETEDGELAHLTLSKLAAHAEGIICLTGGAGGPVGRLLQADKHDAAKEQLKRLHDIFGDRLYVEIERHGLPEQDCIEDALITMAYELNLPLVATNNCYFGNKDMHGAHDALLCIAAGVTIDHQDRRHVTPNHRFRTAEEMVELFADLPEAVANTEVIARRCSFVLQKIDPILPPFDTHGGRPEPEELRAQAKDGLQRCLEAYVFTPQDSEEDKKNKAKAYFDRLEFELGIIEEMGFPGYFLIVSDFIKWAKSQDIPVGPGRGSGAGSVVAWALSITDLDPLRWGLLFERFLNPERVSMPDFDVDFCQDRREEVIAYVQDKYGHDTVAQIITFGKLQARAVVRDVGRVLGMPFGQVDKICKLIPNNPANPVTLGEAIDGEPLLQYMRDNEEDVGNLLSISLKLEGLFRHSSTHAAGVVIGDRPLDELIPLYRDPRSDMPVTQFNMKFVEDAGLVKFDFLGLKTLTVIKEALNLIERHKGEKIDISQIPLDDVDVYGLMSRGETVGVFQLESQGMRDMLKKVRPDRFSDIIALVSLYRPGPMDNIPKYISVKEGLEEPDYLHPLLKPVLEETFGIMIYQEQVMQAAQILAGYSLGGADLLRRAMGKKKKEAMEAERVKFIQGAAKNDIPKDKADSIFKVMEKFAGYGFNKSHAAAYALIAYQTAWLKTHYPAEFMAATMTYDINNTDKLNVFRQELQRLDIDLLPPDVNRSNVLFDLEKVKSTWVVRYALAAIKGVGEAAMQAVVNARNQGGPFKDLFDLVARVDPSGFNKKQVEKLACAGALESLEKNRCLCFTAADTLMQYMHALADEKASGQNSLFGGDAGGLPPPKLPDIEKDWDKLDRLNYEFQAIGFYLSAHPLDAYEKALKKLKIVSSSHVERHLRQSAGSRIDMAGIVLKVTIKNSPDGRRYGFVTLSDASGVYEVRAYQEVLALTNNVLQTGQFVVVRLEVTRREDSLRYTLLAAEPLQDAVGRASDSMIIEVEHPETAAQIREILARQGSGRCDISFLVRTDPMTEVEIRLAQRLAITGPVHEQIRALPGVVEITTL